MFYSLVVFFFFLNACSWALPVGLFTHFKFRACFHRRAGWKTFASLERSQMWWKIQVADIHLMHYAFHVLSRVAVSKSKWSKKKKSDRDTEIEIYTFSFWNRQMPMLIKKNIYIYKKLLDFFFCMDAHQRVDLCQVRGETPQLEATQRRTNSCEIISSGTV